VIVDPRSQVVGTIIYAKAGNIWAQSGGAARQLTIGGSDAMPAWLPDGSGIAYVGTEARVGSFPYQGRLRHYSLQVPTLYRLPVDGSGAREPLLTGLWTSGRYELSYFIRQPAVSPDGTKIALISDGPDPTKSDIVLHVLDLSSGALSSLALPQTSPLGHQDPAWRPDGAVLAYVRPGRDGSRGSSAIWRYTISNKRAAALTGPGYLEPSWSPDGRYLVATRSSSYGTDVVILDAANGKELLRVTADDRSFAPVWSPAGDAIVYLRVDGGVVDLVRVSVRQEGAGWEADSPLDLTQAAGLDPSSRPGWFIPPDQLPVATPSPPPASTASPVQP
jgi:Tol biopolymer transport system component